MLRGPDEENWKIGNEYLFQEFAKKNIELLNNIKFNAIVTYCPHCLNMLKNEYPQFSGSFNVIHYTEILNNLIVRGDIKIYKEMNTKVVYHDPCYLVRANDIYETPRSILNAIPGMKLVEPKHSKRSTFCCGAGGGHMWMREIAGKKINEARVKELVKDKPEAIITSCPYCLIMIDDAIKSLEIGGMRCLDIAEILSLII